MLSKLNIIILLLIISLFPIALNYILMVPLVLPFIGDGKDWIAFWGSYLGSIIAAGVALLVLAKQQKQNHEENMSNRELQVASIKCSLEKEQLSELRNDFVNYIDSYDDVELNRIIKNYNQKKYQKEDIASLHNLKKVVDRQALNLRFSLNNFKDKELTVLLEMIEETLYDSYITFINGTLELYDIMNTLPEDKEVQAEYVNKRLSRLRERDKIWRQRRTRKPNHTKDHFHGNSAVWDSIVNFIDKDDLAKLKNGKYEDVSLYLSSNFSIINLVEMSKDTIENILSKAQQKIYDDLDSKIQ